jgi:hypothetical protein
VYTWHSFNSETLYLLNSCRFAAQVVVSVSWTSHPRRSSSMEMLLGVSNPCYARYHAIACSDNMARLRRLKRLAVKPPRPLRTLIHTTSETFAGTLNEG